MKKRGNLQSEVAERDTDRWGSRLAVWAVLVILSAAVVLLGYQVFVIQANHGTTLRAERLEIVEPDGAYSVVISNSQNTPLAMQDGEVIDPNQNRQSPGIIFYDGRGDEVGGLLLTTLEDFEFGDETLGYVAERHFSLDAYKQDQTVVIHHYEVDGSHSAGLRVLDQPYHHELASALGMDEEASHRELLNALMEADEETQEELRGHRFRVTVGTDLDRHAAVNLHDGEGRERIRMRVPYEGEPHLEFLDEEGEVVRRFPQQE